MNPIYRTGAYAGFAAEFLLAPVAAGVVEDILYRTHLSVVCFWMVLTLKGCLGLEGSSCFGGLAWFGVETPWVGQRGRYTCVLGRVCFRDAGAELEQ